MTETHLIRRNILGITKEFHYADLTRIIACYGRYGRGGPQEYVVYFGKKRVVIICFAVNFDKFLLQLKKRARQSGYKLPKVEEKNRCRAKVPANKKKPKWKKRK